MLWLTRVRWTRYVLLAHVPLRRFHEYLLDFLVAGLARREEGFTERQIAILLAHHGEVRARRRTFEHFPSDRSVLSRSCVQMERENGPKFKQDKLAKALLVCFIDRCTNLPVRTRQKVFPTHTTLLRFRARERRAESPIPSVESKSTPPNRKQPLSKVKPIRNSSTSRRSCARVLSSRSSPFTCAMLEVTTKISPSSNYPSNKSSTPTR